MKNKLFLSAILFGLLTVFFGLAFTSRAQPIIKSLSLPEPVVWLTADAKILFALTKSGNLYKLSGGANTKVQPGLSPDSPIRFAYGNLFGVDNSGELTVLAGSKTTKSKGAALSTNSGLWPLPAGVIAIAQNGDLVRLEQNSQSWKIVTRANISALKDSRVTQADLQGDGDPEIVVLAKPSSDRYQHGVLGDAVEPTSIVALERHSLKTLWRLDLPAPFVFEDIQLRPVLIGGREKLVVARSDPKEGAALSVVSLEGKTLSLSTGPSFGQPSRWLNPVVGFGEIYSVLTPHIGGVLTRYTIEPKSVVQKKMTGGFSNHSIGSRNLNSSLVLSAGHLAITSQNHNSVAIVECSTTCKVVESFKLEGGYTSNMVVFGDQIVIASGNGTVNFLPLSR